MSSPDLLLDFHARAHRNLRDLARHCAAFSTDEQHRPMEGFGIPSIHAQLHHVLGAERYWVGVLEGRMDVEEDAGRYPDVPALEALRVQVFGVTQAFLKGISADALLSPRPVATWNKGEQVLAPVQVLMRVITHVYQHQGQVVAMARLLGRPAPGLDYPIEESLA